MAQKLHDGDARDFFGVLKAQEQPGLAADVGGPRRDVRAFEEQAPRGDLVVGVAEQRVGERRLPRAVGAHEGMDLAGRDREIDAAQDLGTRHASVEVVDFEQGGLRSHDAILLPLSA